MDFFLPKKLRQCFFFRENKLECSSSGFGSEKKKFVCVSVTEMPSIQRKRKMEREEEKDKVLEREREREREIGVQSLRNKILASKPFDQRRKEK